MVENTFNLSTSLMFPTEKSAHKQHKNNLETFYDCTEAFFFNKLEVSGSYFHRKSVLF